MSKDKKEKQNNNVSINAKCTHTNKEKKRIMDFSFFICLDCGYQWKA